MCVRWRCLCALCAARSLRCCLDSFLSEVFKPWSSDALQSIGSPRQSGATDSEVVEVDQDDVLDVDSHGAGLSLSGSITPEVVMEFVQRRRSHVKEVVAVKLQR